MDLYIQALGGSVFVADPLLISVLKDRGAIPIEHLYPKEGIKRLDTYTSNLFLQALKLACK